MELNKFEEFIIREMPFEITDPENIKFLYGFINRNKVMVEYYNNLKLYKLSLGLKHKRSIKTAFAWGFDWGETSQGYSFWEDINNKYEIHMRKLKEQWREKT